MIRSIEEQIVDDIQAVLENDSHSDFTKLALIEDLIYGDDPKPIRRIPQMFDPDGSISEEGGKYYR